MTSPLHSYCRLVMMVQGQIFTCPRTFPFRPQIGWAYRNRNGVRVRIESVTWEETRTGSGCVGGRCNRDLSIGRFRVECTLLSNHTAAELATGKLGWEVVPQTPVKAEAVDPLPPATTEG